VPAIAILAKLISFTPVHGSFAGPLLVDDFAAGLRPGWTE
jgi:hypothetical protein